VAGLFALLALLLVASSAVAQSDYNPQWDVFAGYQFTHPGTTVPLGDPTNPTAYKIPDMTKGFGMALTYNFDPHFGLEGDFGYGAGNSNSETTGSIGPRFMWRTDDANFFAHALFGGNWLSVNGINTGTAGIGAIIGGGIDLPVTKSVSWRLFEADYVFGKHRYTSLATAQFPDLQRPTLNGVRLRTGIVFAWGGVEPVPPTASCSVQPSEVFVGEPIAATVSASNFDPKHTVAYSWSGNGGQVTGKDTAASIDTANAAPGSYTVTAHVTDARAKKNNEASCSANYTVKALPPKNPPTVSLSASPASVVTGGSANVSASCTSPDGVPVSVANWTATSGTVSGSGNSATLSTSGVAPGSVTVGATCTDSRGLTGQATTQVTVEKPPLPPVDKALEARLSLHSVYFPTAQPPVKDPNAGLIASQQKTLTDLAGDFQVYLKSKPDAHLILEGHADQRGSAAYNQALSERRVARVKSFLVEHGVSEAIIETKALGDQHNLTADEVKASIEADQGLTKEERARILRNMRTIILASNRRVDINLSTTGEVSTRTFPFNAADSLTLIGGRTKASPAAKKPAPKKK
jgi:outer membrane protein OmpA-like peptidoglycan-associated protein